MSRGYLALVTGAGFLPMTIAVLAGNVLAGRLVGLVGLRREVAGSALLVAVALAGLLVVGPSTAFATLAAPLVVLGFGLGALVPAITNALLGSVEANRSGVAAGTLNTARQTGSMIGVALFGALANGRVLPGLRISLVVSIALALVTLALAVALPR